MMVRQILSKLLSTWQQFIHLVGFAYILLQKFMRKRKGLQNLQVRERTVYHLFVRERGQFKSESIYLRYGSFTAVLTFNIFEI